MKKISDKGLDLIKSFEGCRLKAYKCPAGVWTIGWGHTGDVVAGQTITQQQADQMLRDDMAAYEQQVLKYDDLYTWNQNEFDALTSFAYNVGSIHQLTANGTRSRDLIADKLLEYNKGGGKVLAGLTRRRQAERELFLTPETADAGEPGWKHDQYGWWYHDGNGRYPSDCWRNINGYRYYFNEDGYAVTDWQQIDGKWYYFEPTRGHAQECAMYKTDENGAQAVARV